MIEALSIFYLPSYCFITCGQSEGVIQCFMESCQISLTPGPDNSKRKTLMPPVVVEGLPLAL